MGKKDHSIQARLTNEEYLKLQSNCAECGMTQSEFIRSAILNKPIAQMKTQQVIMVELCKMLNTINCMNQTQATEELKERVQQICRYLK